MQLARHECPFVRRDRAFTLLGLPHSGSDGCQGHLSNLRPTGSGRFLPVARKSPLFTLQRGPVQTKIKPYPKYTTTVIGAHSVPDWYEKVPPRSRGAWRNTASASLPAHARLIRVNLSSPIID
jgi:hypothetical protein